MFYNHKFLLIVLLNGMYYSLYTCKLIDIEQKGKIELESEKSNINYDIVKVYFRNNYPMLVSQVDNMQFKLSYLINKKNSTTYNIRTFLRTITVCVVRCRYCELPRT